MRFEYLKAGGEFWQWAKRLVDDLNKSQEVTVPIGGMVFWAGGDIPLNYLECDGATYSRSVYPELYLALGGVGPTFDVPSETSPISQPLIIRAR